MCLMSDASGYMGSPPGVHATVGEYKTTLLPSGSLLVKVGQARRQKLGWLLLGFAPFWREKLSFLKCKMCKTLWNEHWTCCIEILKIELELLQKPSWLLVFNPHCVLELLLKAWPLCTQVPDRSQALFSGFGFSNWRCLLCRWPLTERTLSPSLSYLFLWLF